MRSLNVHLDDVDFRKIASAKRRSGLQWREWLLWAAGKSEE